MRAALLASVTAIGVLGLSAASQAAPSAFHDLAIGTPAPSIEQVRGGCGPGWHPRGWRDRWGYWRSRCVPNRW